MKVAIVVLLAALTAKSLSGQVALGGHFGPVASRDGSDNSVRLGIFAGVSAEFEKGHGHNVISDLHNVRQR